MADREPYAEADLELELMVPINPRTGQRTGDWQGTPIRLQELPSVSKMASVIHEGAQTGLNRAYIDLYAWLQANAFEITGPFREIYLPESGINLTQPLDGLPAFIELQCPVERAAVPISLFTSETSLMEKIMKPKIVKKPAMTVVGMAYQGKNENQEIPAMWGEFNPRMNEIKNITGNQCFGACFSDIEGAAEGEFEYVACFEVTDASEVPAGMVVRTVPAYTYAVFTHVGKLATLPDTYQYIYTTWLPQAGVELHPDKFDMELYDEHFKPDTDDSEIDILVAIKG